MKGKCFGEIEGKVRQLIYVYNVHMQRRAIGFRGIQILAIQ